MASTGYTAPRQPPRLFGKCPGSVILKRRRRCKAQRQTPPTQIQRFRAKSQTALRLYLHQSLCSTNKQPVVFRRLSGSALNLQARLNHLTRQISTKKRAGYTSFWGIQRDRGRAPVNHVCDQISSRAFLRRILRQRRLPFPRGVGQQRRHHPLHGQQIDGRIT